MEDENKHKNHERHGDMDHSDHGDDGKEGSHEGHRDHGDHSAHIADFRRRFLVSLILTIPILLLSQTIQDWFGFEITIPYQEIVIFLLAAVVYFYGGWPFLKGTANELRKRLPGMMTLIAMAISVAFFYSSATVFFLEGKDFFWELATLIDVMLLGHWIEAKSVMGASRALEELVKVMPTSAHLVRGDEVVDVLVSDLKVGDIVLVKPGEKIPSDGVVVKGDSFVNESMLTGESKPVHKDADDKVIGGALNSEGSLTVKVEKTGKETYLSQVIDLVEKAQESRSRTQDLANRAAAMLFYIALSVGVVTYLVWFTLGQSDFALERSVTVLVIACPHALGLAIPLVVALSTSITARSGILIRDRRAFETARDIDAMVFDKTGTLTEGRFGVTDTIAFSSEEDLLRLTAAVESNSEHIIARAILDEVSERGVEIPDVEDFKVIPGKGAFGIVEGREVHVGGPNLLKELDIQIDDERTKKLQSEGKTVVFTIADGEPMGAFALSDRVRKESAETIEKLRSLGIRTYMLTGDSKEVAEAVSKELGIDDYFAQVLPHEKAEYIESLREEGYHVAMVGDGINDAPALVTADVGVAIGAGTDVAIESADIILVKNDPRDVSKLIDLSKKTYSKMVQNLWWAGGYNIVAIPLAAGILFNQGVVISPAVGAILMSLSTVIVAINSQTLRKYMPDED
ncbi:MAG: cadmium-translocating P-type ATPase [Methanomassiliicoccales archaeon]|nr:cadmium-translocating P-type ATPase [Methanomassiliicoccales archaeon]